MERDPYIYVCTWLSLPPSTAAPLYVCVVYCAPGKHGVDEDDPPENFVLWTNADGRPRKKSVLNPAGERITLIDSNDIEVGR